MKFQFKIQKYQTASVSSIVKVFAGQTHDTGAKYTRDKGIRTADYQQSMFDADNNIVEKADEIDVGFANNDIVLTDTDILKNIQEVQTRNNINMSDSLVRHVGRCSLDIEMETGTGKTYCYIKTIFELNKQYGWTKFIIVVPSIAIREGVKKSFEMMEEHFMESYRKKARFFIYNSAKLNDLDTFSSSNNISVMIINAQAFNASGKDARRIYEKLDAFQSRKPIDVIAANRPVIILDEPQKLGGEKTQNSLKLFKPLFCLSYSATHKKKNNMVYVLDALEAYNQKLVKKIEVKGFEIKNHRGCDGYLYLSSILLSPKKPPRARIEMEINQVNGFKRILKFVDVNDNLYHLSASKSMPSLEQYKHGYVVSNINPIDNTVTFTNGLVLRAGEMIGDYSETDLRRIQIRETILSHFEKEEKNFYKGIKTLSLFFIDKVSKYKQYDDKNNELNGEYAVMFEDEYTSVLNHYLSLLDSPYVKYLEGIEAAKTHNGYFSIDKKNGNKMIDGSLEKRGEMAGLSNDISAYDLILKNKERLLSFEEPTRFIFSHSALREGWDNPNIFQICTLKKSDDGSGDGKKSDSSKLTRRQEVGRGMRICVNSDGERMDASVPNINFRELNKLTVITSGGYAKFVSELQEEIVKDIYNRPKFADKEFFIDKIIGQKDGENVFADKRIASSIYKYLVKNDYIDNDDKIAALYREDLEAGKLATLPDELIEYAAGIQVLIQSVYDESVLKNMVANGNKSTIKENNLNENFYKAQFQDLWKQINHKYAYRVSFNSDELVKNAIAAIDEKLYVTTLQYISTIGEQRDTMSASQLERGDSIERKKGKYQELKRSGTSNVEYDLVGMIAKGTNLTRRTVTAILKGIKPYTFAKFAKSPEEFVSKVCRLINEQKATIIVKHISYNTIEGHYEDDIFTMEKPSSEFDKAVKSDRHILDYVFVDSIKERDFALELNIADAVQVYAKLPRGFSIPTPVGNYSPDWAIAFDKDKVKHIYFIAETKGSMSSMQITDIEKCKIACAKELYASLSGGIVKYDVISTFEELMMVVGDRE